MRQNADNFWSPHLQCAIKQIESVQHKFTKRLHGLANISYNSRLAWLHIDSLEIRHLRFDLIIVYKILCNMVDVSAMQFFTRFSSSYNTRGHSYKLVFN